MSRERSASKLVERYVRFLDSRAGLVLIVAAVVTTLAGLSASRFRLKTDFAELLPQDEPSIRHLEEAKKRMGGLSNLIVAVEGDDVDSNHRLVDDLVQKFKDIPKDYVVYIKYNIKEEKRFYEKYKHLYVDLEDLQELYERLHEKVRYERIKNNPLLSMDFDGEQPKPVEFSIDDIKEKYKRKASKTSGYIDDYFTGEDGRLWVILLYPPGAATGVDFGKRMLLEVKKAAASVCAKREVTENDPQMLEDLLGKCRESYHSSSRISFAGSIVTAIDEQKAIVDDLVLVTSICLFFVGLVILLYFRTMRCLPLIGVPLLMGTTWTFGISIYIVGHLNNSTAFLAAIIVGNGINFGLMQLARYIEERRAGKEHFEALLNAVRFTARSTSTAALAASIAYGSLIITRFRGFNGFGYMGGLGMVLCWLAAFSVQPAMTGLLERLKPLKIKKKTKRLPDGLFARPYARIAIRYGIPLHVAGALFAIVCVIWLVPYLEDPFEYNFRNLRNQTANLKGSGKLTLRVDKIFPRRLNPMFVLPYRQDQVPQVTDQLVRLNTSGSSRGLFQDIVSIYTLLPDRQKKKIRVLKKLRRLMTDATLSWLDEEQRKEALKYRPPADLRPITVKDLPHAMTRMFTELDGTVGLPVALYPRQGSSIWDGHFLLELDGVTREIHLPNGETLTSAGTHTVFADMIRAIERDGPRAVAASLVGVLILVLLAYRGLRYVILMLISLAYGIVWTVGPAAMIDLRLNFLNFIALPITFGIGIDYAVNVLNRYRLEGRGSIQKVISSTGGAVILCSLTTLIGYSSLLIADNRALVSFGILSDIGEVASLAAAVFMLPIMIHLFEKRDERKAAQSNRAAARG
ncbi:MAG: hypothetical protein D6806_04365 [Deltaproteobacteria bacterium]|nr:MAG: hypothetical protein D6806_04365 [Deltaproteobacteria bacterium]